MITNCLTYEQLQAYSSATINKIEKNFLYMHISGCELCASAVNGFAAIPFVSDELVAIHRKIDARTNATAANPLTFSRVMIMIVSFIAIGAVYIIADHPKSKTITASTTIKVQQINTPIINEKKTAFPEEVSSVTKTYKKIVNRIQYQKFERTISNEKLDIIEPISVHTLMRINDNFPGDLLAPDRNVNSLYIYDLKISDYNNLYFNLQKKEDNSLFKNHTSVLKENKKSVVEESEGTEEIPSDKILKKGLLAFREQNFNIALLSFNSLLEKNRTDVNAQFYSALSYYNLNNFKKAADRLNEVLKNDNTAFYSEAQWYSALASLKAGETESAKSQLSRIVSEKGFYSKSARQKLNSL